MTVSEAIERVDALLQNDYSRSDKIKWLSELDWKIKTTILDDEKFSFYGYDDSDFNYTDLLAPPAFEELYLYWLEAKIHYYNGDNDQYNAAMILFNSVMQEFGDHHIRNHKSAQSGRFRF